MIGVNPWNAAQELHRLRLLPPGIQQAHRDEIIAAFRALWRSAPTEPEFAAATAGLVVFPEMLYIMVREEWLGRREG